MNSRFFSIQFCGCNCAAFVLPRTNRRFGGVSFLATRNGVFFGRNRAASDASDDKRFLMPARSVLGFHVRGYVVGLFEDAPKARMVGRSHHSNPADMTMRMKTILAVTRIDAKTLSLRREVILEDIVCPPLIGARV